MTVRRMLAVSDVRGDADKLAEALETDRHDAVAVVGDLAGEREDTVAGSDTCQTKQRKSRRTTTRSEGAWKRAEVAPRRLRHGRGR
jgi:Icc-related predicted phosphoesterase